MSDEPPRSRLARLAAEQALVRIVHHYGERPAFVVLGGLVPELLCSGSRHQHAGTTDIDVQVNLEIEFASVSAVKLERALRNAEFEPDSEQVWRWRMVSKDVRAEVKFELLADLDSEANEATLRFDGCEHLGAVNLRGTKYATQDIESRKITSKVGDDQRSVEINVTGVAGFPQGRRWLSWLPTSRIRRRKVRSRTLISFWLITPTTIRRRQRLMLFRRRVLRGARSSAANPRRRVDVRMVLVLARV